MKQQTLTGFEKYGKTTRRAKFLADMDRIIPWPEMTSPVATVYPKISEQGGRPPIPLERMLRIYFLQLWFNLSDPAVEEELYDSAAMRSFVGIDLRCGGGAGRDDDLQVPRLAREEQTGGTRCCARSTNTCIATVSRSPTAPSWTPPLSAHRARPRTKRASAILRCTR